MSTAGILLALSLEGPASATRRENPRILVGRGSGTAGILPASADKREDPSIFVGRGFSHDINSAISERL
jgi:hypothetical protein